MKEYATKHGVSFEFIFRTRYNMNTLYKMFEKYTSIFTWAISRQRTKEKVL